MNYGQGYDDDHSQQPQAGCISRLLPILVMGTVAFWFMQKNRVRQPNQPPNGAPRQVEPNIQMPNVDVAPRLPRSDREDWSIEQVESAPRSEPARASNGAAPTSTTEGDWSIEEVESKSNGSNKKPATQVDVNDPQTTEKGDWVIEEVEAGPPK